MLWVSADDEAILRVEAAEDVEPLRLYALSRPCIQHIIIMFKSGLK